MRAGRLKKSLKQSSLLTVANIFGPALNDSLTFKVPIARVALNRDLPREIEQMRKTAAHYRMGYITANHVESFQRVCLVNRRMVNPHALTHADYGQPEDFNVYINPEVVEGRGQLGEVEESCLTFPFLRFKVQRYPEVLLKFHDLQTSVEEVLGGTTAQLLQHCIHHLEGELLIDYRLSHGKFYVDKETLPYFARTSFLLREYSHRLQDYHEVGGEEGKFKAMQEDYLGRIKKEYEVEGQRFTERIAKKNL